MSLPTASSTLVSFLVLALLGACALIEPIDDNIPPVFTVAPQDQSVLRNTLTPNAATVTFSVADEDGDTLGVAIGSSDQTVIADDDLEAGLACVGVDCTLSFIPDPDRSAEVTITITLDDGRAALQAQAQTSATFTLELVPTPVVNALDAGPGSLRQALLDADPGAVLGFDDESVFAAVQTILLTGGQLRLDRTVTIEGTGATNLFLSGNGVGRVFEIASGADVAVEGLGIVDGVATDCPTASDACGGGILVNAGGSLTLSDSTVGGNSADDEGGGIFNAGSASIRNSTITGNEAAAGGGLYNLDGGTVTIQAGSAIDGNTATIIGGGILNDGGGTITIDGSSVDDNAADSNGGGVFNDSDATLTVRNGSSVAGNKIESGGGGGIFNFGGTLTIDSSSIAGNTAAIGGGIHHFAFGLGAVMVRNNSAITGNTAAIGGGIYNETTVTIDSSSIANNTATESGGGIYNFSGTMTIQNNSAITGNTANDDGGGIYNNDFGTLALDSTSAVSLNTADADNDTFGEGGGLFNSNGDIAGVDPAVIVANLPDDIAP